MAKVELKFIYKDEQFDLEFENKSIKCYTNSSSSFAVITDKDNNVILEVTADCAQNSGFLEVKSV